MMVKVGSGGAVFAAEGMNDQDYIIGRLPIARANHYVRLFWALQRNPITGEGIRCRKPDHAPAATRRIL